MVAAGQGAADVDNHNVARLDHTVGVIVVRVGAVRAGADDDEVHHLVLFEDQAFQFLGHVVFRHACAQQVRDLAVDFVDGGAGAAQLGKLFVVLADERLGEHLGGIHGGDAAGLQFQQVVGGHGSADSVGSFGDVAVGVFAVVPPDDLHAELARHGLLQICDIHAGDDDAGGVLSKNQSREPLVRADLRRDQVLHVRTGGGDHAVQAGLRGGFADGGEALAKRFGWEEFTHGHQGTPRGLGERWGRWWNVHPRPR